MLARSRAKLVSIASFFLSVSASLSSFAASLAAPPEAEPKPIAFHASLGDGIGFKTAGNVFSLDAGALTQMQFQLIMNGPKLASDGFNVLMVRPYLRVRAFGDTVRLFVQPELGTQNPRLLDYEVTYQPLPELGIRVGQFLTPFSRAFLTPVPLLQFQDFSRVNARFRADRDTGLMVFGAPAQGKFEYYMGAFNGNGIDKGGNDDRSIMGIGRLAISPVRAMPYDETPSLRGPVPFGISFAANAIADRAHPKKTQIDPTTGAQTTVDLAPETRLTAGGDIAIAWDRFTFLGEAFLKQVKPDDAAQARGYGMYGQAGYFVIPKHLELAARVGFLDPNKAKPSDTETSVEGQVNAYVVGNHLKMGLRYQYLHLDAATQDGLAAGVNHRFLAQMQLWI